MTYMKGLHMNNRTNRTQERIGFASALMLVMTGMFVTTNAIADEVAQLDPNIKGMSRLPEFLGTSTVSAPIH